MELSMQLALAITALGIINTIYLCYHAIKGTVVYCLFLPDEWCQKVQKSDYSKTFGVPNPYLGFGMLTTIFVLLYLSIKTSVILVLAKAFIIFGFLFSLYFLYIQAFKIQAFCTWCVVSALIFSALFFIQFYL
jgi:uncharacterized membrane protein